MSPPFRALWIPLALLGLSCASLPGSADSPAAIAAQYYAGIAGERDVATIPMAPALRFRGPGRSAEDAESFRQALRGLAPQVRSLSVRRQLVAADAVMTFYDLDLGAPSGPIPMAEKLRIQNGQIVEVELLFDSRRLPISQ